MSSSSSWVSFLSPNNPQWNPCQGGLGCLNLHDKREPHNPGLHTLLAIYQTRWQHFLISPTTSLRLVEKVQSPVLQRWGMWGSSTWPNQPGAAPSDSQAGLCSGCPQGSFGRLESFGNSLAVQWLGQSAFTAETRVQSLVREIRSHKPQGVAKQNKNKTNRFTKSSCSDWLKNFFLFLPSPPLHPPPYKGRSWEDVASTYFFKRDEVTMKSPETDTWGLAVPLGGKPRKNKGPRHTAGKSREKRSSWQPRARIRIKAISE